VLARTSIHPAIARIVTVHKARRLHPFRELNLHNSPDNSGTDIAVRSRPIPIRVNPAVLEPHSGRGERLVSNTKFPYLFAVLMILISVASVALADAATEQDMDRFLRSVEMVARQFPLVDTSNDADGMLSARGRNILLSTLVLVVSISVLFGFYLNRLAVRSRSDLKSRAAEEVENVETAKRRFIDTATHELNTPLTVTTALTDVLSRNREGNLTERQLRQLEAIKRNNRHLVDLVDLMIQTSEAGKIAEYPRENVRYSEFLETTLTSIRNELELGEIKLEWSIEHSTDEVEIYPGRIAKVISHLVINAGRNVDKPGVVRVFTADDDGKIVTCIVNREIEIPEQEKELLFTPFYRADTEINRRVRGLGLGLTVVKQVVESYGGSVNVYSDEDDGTQFCFTLPKVA